jgi:hypothetical protein
MHEEGEYVEAVIVMATCIVSLSNSSKHDGDGGGSGGA